MSRIYIQRQHELDGKTVRKRAEALAKQLQSEYGGHFRWEGDTVHYSYSGGIDARMTLQDDDILVDVKLGVLMLLLKGPLTREIERYLDLHLKPEKHAARAPAKHAAAAAKPAPAGKKAAPAKKSAGTAASAGAKKPAAAKKR
jgi:putative polyhydroxyalkanoate system protein